ncbi:MAG: STAS domain-containing protein [Prevotella sp.]|jgi:anti-sigma B factor antagonist|nr:STAS domain-containing protein [Prevotella sp.]MBR5391683.1 STAS domain-containing protein [Prevotella sp.]
MNITINEQEGKLVAVLEGDLDNVASTQAERNLAPVFDCTDKDVVIDCTDLNYISSSGLRILLNIYKHTRTNGHNAILRGLKDDVKEVFQISGFLQLFITE